MTVLQDQKWKWVCRKKGGDVLEGEERVGKFIINKQNVIFLEIICIRIYFLGLMI